VVFVKDLSYFEVRQIAHGGQVLPTGGHLNLLCRFGFGVSLGGVTGGFLQSKNKGTKCRDDTLSEPTKNATEPRGQKAIPYPQWNQSPL
jgi:hypothetical protein